MHEPLLDKILNFIYSAFFFLGILAVIGGLYYFIKALINLDWSYWTSFW